MSDQSAAAAERATRTLGCTNQGITSRARAVLSLSKLDRLCLEYSFDPCYTKKKICGQVGMGPEKSHKDDPKPGKLPHEERLRTGCFNS